MNVQIIESSIERSFVCLFVCMGVFVPLENFSLIWIRQYYRWRLQILTYARHLRPLSSEGTLACHTYCNMGQPFKMVISEDPWHSYLWLSVWQWSCHYLFLRLRSVAAGIQTPNLPRRTRDSNIWQWSCHYLFLRLGSVAPGIRTPNNPLAGRKF